MQNRARSRADRMHAQGGHSLMLAFFVGFGACGAWTKYKLQHTSKRDDEDDDADDADDAQAKSKTQQGTLSLLVRALATHKRLLSWPHLFLAAAAGALASAHADAAVALVSCAWLTLSLLSLWLA